MAAGAIVNKRPNDRDDGLLLFERQLTVDWNSERLVGGLLGVREVAAPIAEIGEARLQMERYRVIDFVANALLVEMPLERVALGRLDHELVVDVEPVGSFRRQLDRVVET